MRVSEYIEQLVAGDTNRLSFSDVGDMRINPDTPPTTAQIVNQNKHLVFINQANLALHKRFHLVKKTFEFDIPLDGEEYTLPDDFLIPINAYYEEDDEPVTVRDTHVRRVDGVDVAVSILLPEPFKAVIKGNDSKNRKKIIMRYAAAPRKATQVSNDLGLSEVYTEALLNYAAYKAHSTLGAKLDGDNNTYYLRYEASCRQITQSGMWGNNEIETNTKLEDNGFV